LVPIASRPQHASIRSGQSSCRLIRDPGGHLSCRDGAYLKTETSGSRTMRAEVINNNNDPVTNVLTNPFSLVSLAWGAAKCHDYSSWDYQRTSPVTVVCP
jgi:hypothetical protein